MTRIVDVRIARFNPRKDRESRYETYKVPYVDGMSVFNALEYIKDTLDGSLAYYMACCRVGKCLGCGVTIDGKNKLLCTEPLRPGMTIEPLKGHEIIRDLVTIP